MLEEILYQLTLLYQKDESVTALAVDWVTSNLYWSSTERPDLHVTSRHGGYTTSLLQGSLKVKDCTVYICSFFAHPSSLISHLSDIGVVLRPSALDSKFNCTL